MKECENVSGLDLNLDLDLNLGLDPCGEAIGGDDCTSTLLAP